MNITKIVFIPLIILTMTQFTSCDDVNIYKEVQKPIAEKEIALDVEMKEIIEQLNERDIIKITHEFMNDVWCNEGESRLQGDQDVIFEALLERWEKFEFLSEAKYDLMIDSLVTTGLKYAQNDSQEIREFAHRIFHQLDYYVLETTEAQPGEDYFIGVVLIPDGELNEWKK